MQDCLDSFQDNCQGTECKHNNDAFLNGLLGRLFITLIQNNRNIFSGEVVVASAINELMPKLLQRSLTGSIAYQPTCTSLISKLCLYQPGSKTIQVQR